MQYIYTVKLRDVVLETRSRRLGAQISVSVGLETLNLGLGLSRAVQS